jgi:hypothetical protein
MSTTEATREPQPLPAVGARIERGVRRLATMGEPYGPCNYGGALIDAARRYGPGDASFAVHGCIDAPQQIVAGGLTAAWWEWSTWGGPEGGTLNINTVSRDA